MFKLKSCGSDRALTFACLIVVLLMYFVPLVYAQDKDDNPDDYLCSLPSDRDVASRFNLAKWVERGTCVRQHGPGRDCFSISGGILQKLVKGREYEYAGAANVLALLPTIGALFGSPTSEIWRLKSILPFGGLLAMSLSFGGALMPVHVEDYEKSVTEQDTSIGSIVSLRKSLRKQASGSSKDVQTPSEKLSAVARKIQERIDKHESLKLPKKYMMFGLIGMLSLWSMAQVAMAIVEQGGVVNFWCSSQYWMHLWYFAGQCIAA